MATYRQKREERLTSKLCDMLAKTGLDAETLYRDGIVVTLNNIRVVIKCVPSKCAIPIQDATSHLISDWKTEVRIVVAFPPKCRVITYTTELDYTIITIHDAKSDHTIWNTVCVDGLAEVIRSVGAEPDKLAKDLKKLLTKSTRRLSTSQRIKLAHAIQLDESGAARALLMVVSAALFHARVDVIKPIKRPHLPMTLQECIDKPNTVEALSDAWCMICTIHDQPILRMAQSVLDAADGVMFTCIVRDLARWAYNTIRVAGGLQHDLLGRIFHTMLDSAKHDGSYYTSVPAAILLVGLAIRKRSDIPDTLEEMRVMDPACGTGTLLMATAERVDDVMRYEYDSKVMIENVMYGMDINVTALHLAATTLGFLSPTTKFGSMNIRQAKFGVLDRKIRARSRVRTLAGKVAAGSLELYDKSQVLDWYYNWVGQDGGKPGRWRYNEEYMHAVDLVIMNPPFTRHDTRHTQLGENAKKLVMRREQEIFKDAPVTPNKTSSGIMFLVLGEHLTKLETGTFAFVFPLSGATAASTQPIRKFLAERFHIDTIVVSHDPKRFWFSENTRISEMLVIMRRRTRHLDTRIINLAVNPSTTPDAAKLAKDIREGADMQTVWWPKSYVRRGDWAGVQFYSPYLVEQFRRIRDGELLQVVELGKIADVGPNGRTITMYMNRSETPGRYGWASIYGNETGRIRSMQVEPYTYVTPKHDKIKEAERFWEQRSTLLLPERIRLNLARVSAIYSTIPTIGASWTGVIQHIQEMWSATHRVWWNKAMAAYLNSTVGMVALLGVRIPKDLTYPTYSLDENQRRIPVPDFTQTQASQLAAVYDRLCNNTLGLLRDSSDKTRIALDDTVCKTLGIEGVDRIRYELSREPMITGKRYGE